MIGGMQVQIQVQDNNNIVPETSYKQMLKRDLSTGILTSIYRQNPIQMNVPFHQF